MSYRYSPFYSPVPAFCQSLKGSVHVIRMTMCYLFRNAWLCAGLVWVDTRVEAIGWFCLLLARKKLQQSDKAWRCRQDATPCAFPCQRQRSASEFKNFRRYRPDYMAITSATFPPNLSGRAIELEFSPSGSHSLAWSISAGRFMLMHASSVATAYSKRLLSQKFNRRTLTFGSKTGLRYWSQRLRNSIKFLAKMTT